MVSTNETRDRQFYKNQYLSRIGETRLNNMGSLMIIDDYKNATDITVRFVEHGNFVRTTYNSFIKGSVKNVYDKTSYGIGFIGEGKYKVTSEGKITPQYATWIGIFGRCYSISTVNKNPTYKNCEIDPLWHNFQNFAQWYDENFYQVENEKMNLDKDILFKGNRIYSPDTCIFAPASINTLFTKGEAKRGEYPIGVKYDKRWDSYEAQCKDSNSKNKYLGYFKTINEAFNSYKVFKEQLIKETANKYKDKIPSRLFNAMISYEVDITD